MKKLFNYWACAIAYLYKKCGMEDYLAQGYFLVCFTITNIILSLAQICLFQFGKRLDVTDIVILCIPGLIEIFFFRKIFPRCEQYFEAFENNKSKVKWLIAILALIFFLLSFAGFVITLVVFKP